MQHVSRKAKFWSNLALSAGTATLIAGAAQAAPLV